MYSLKRDESPWPIVEWRDNTGVIGMAIFDFTDGNETDAGGWLMHVGVGVGNGDEPGFFWQQSKVELIGVSKICGFSKLYSSLRNIFPGF